MSSNGRLFKQDNISADTGEINLTGLGMSPPHPSPGYTEWGIINLRMRLTTHTADAVGQYLCSVRWNDGVSDQSWDVALSVVAGNYSEVGMQIWADESRNVTVQVVPLVAGGSVDVQIMGEF
jgi:hypothetical protein